MLLKDTFNDPLKLLRGVVVDDHLPAIIGSLEGDLGAEILGHDSITQGDKDFTPLLTKIRASSPDLIYFGGMYPEGALLVKQARGLGMKTRPFWSNRSFSFVKSFINVLS